MGRVSHQQLCFIVVGLDYLSCKCCVCCYVSFHFLEVWSLFIRFVFNIRQVQEVYTHDFEVVLSYDPLEDLVR